ncbi:acyl-CoA-binding domain-containing protein 6-like isoform X2 [Rhopilema esculentum]|uniref:acyl-CoA-binding domain-containing protein 6-like isoform X2 n=1 Tax=Rhopilema esculentum TaxID=499914 RepID=UPI0031DACB04
MKKKWKIIASTLLQNMHENYETSVNRRCYNCTATAGPCTTPKPGFWDIVGKSKWESWKKLEKMDKETAKEGYIILVQELDPTWDIDEESLMEDDSETKKAGHGMGVSVSTMSYGEDQYISNEDKSIFDWCKENVVSKVAMMLGTGNFQVNSKDENGMTMLHWSSDRGHNDMVNLLIKNGADINMQDNDLQTSLHYAVVCEHAHVIKGLLERGANANLQDDTGATPLDVATSPSIKDLIKEFSKSS